MVMMYIIVGRRNGQMVKEGFMRKIVFLLVICSFVSLAVGCDSIDTTVNSNEEFLGYLTDTKDYYDTGIGIYPEDFQIDEKLALEIGNAVIKSYCTGYEDDVLEKTEGGVYKIKENMDSEIFVVYRWYPDSVGGGHYVAISGKDGAILKIWGDE